MSCVYLNNARAGASKESAEAELEGQVNQAIAASAATAAFAAVVSDPAHAARAPAERSAPRAGVDPREQRVAGLRGQARRHRGARGARDGAGERGGAARLHAGACEERARRQVVRGELHRRVRHHLQQDRSEPGERRQWVGERIGEWVRESGSVWSIARSRRRRECCALPCTSLSAHALDAGGLEGAEGRRGDKLRLEPPHTANALNKQNKNKLLQINREK